MVLEIPSKPDEITSEWLTEALRSTGVITRSSATVAANEALAVGQGFAGQLARLAVSYDRADATAPTSIIAKLPSAHQPTRAYMDRVGAYAREVSFYLELGGHIELRTPRLFYGAREPETGDFILLLEDLSSLRSGDQVASCTVDEATLVVQHVAALHAGWWESPRLDTSQWISPWDAGADAAEELYGQARGPFLEGLGGQLPLEFREIVDQLGPHVARIKHELAESPTTLVHGDLRLDNLFFGREDSDPALAVVDWQACRRGQGIGDIAYFLALSLDGPVRREVEADLLADYHRTLIEKGVAGYSLDECLRNYRLSLLDRVGFIVSIGATLDFTSRRGVAVANAVLPRFVSAVVDHGVESLIPTV